MNFNFYFSGQAPQPPQYKGNCFLCGKPNSTIIAPDNGEYEGDSEKKPRLLCEHCVKEYHLINLIIFHIQKYGDSIIESHPINFTRK